MNILPVVDGVTDSKDVAYYFMEPFDATAPSPPLPPGGAAPPNTYRRPSETYDHYRKLFGQANT